jgi:hypothetical protein
MKIPEGTLTPKDVKLDGDKFISDTGELIWDLSQKDRGVVTINTARSKAVIGFGAGRRFDLGGVVIEPSQTIQDGWCAITLTAIEGDFEAVQKQQKGLRVLITATGYAENTDMGWKDVPGYPPKSSCGRNWGKPPSLVEGISATITLPLQAKRVQAWALDERGQRKAKIQVTADASGNAVIRIAPQWQTLWYEVEAQ